LGAKFYITWLCLLISGCAVGAIETDLVNYINQEISGITEVEQAALKRYAAVSGPNYLSDEILYNALKDEVVPTYERFVRALQRIEPQTEPVRQMHAKYINASVYRLRGFSTIMNGIHSQDLRLIQAANRMLAVSDREMNHWQQSLQTLYDTYGIRDN
jgi:hypothetical protein